MSNVAQANDVALQNIAKMFGRAGNIPKMPGMMPGMHGMPSMPPGMFGAMSGGMPEMPPLPEQPVAGVPVMLSAEAVTELLEDIKSVAPALSTRLPRLFAAETELAELVLATTQVLAQVSMMLQCLQAAANAAQQHESIGQLEALMNARSRMLASLPRREQAKAPEAAEGCCGGGCHEEQDAVASAAAAVNHGEFWGSEQG